MSACKAIADPSLSQGTTKFESNMEESLVGAEGISSFPVVRWGLGLGHVNREGEGEFGVAIIGLILTNLMYIHRIIDPWNRI